MNIYENPELERDRKLAEALMSQGMNPQPVAGQFRRSGIAASAGSALMGALVDMQATKRDNQRRAGINKTLAEALRGPQAPADGTGPMQDKNDYLASVLAGNPDTAPLAFDFEMKRRMGNVGGQTPSDIQVYEYWKGLDPQGREDFARTQRAPRWLDTGPNFTQAPTFPGGGGNAPPPIPKGVDPRDTPENAAARAAAEEAARRAAEATAGKNQKAPALDNLNYLNNQFKKAQAETSTGGPLGVKGLASRGLDYQNVQRFNNIREQISTELRTIFRIPGEGTLSDREQAQYGLQLPDIKNDPEVNDQIMADIMFRSQSRVGQGQGDGAASDDPLGLRR